MAKEKRYFVTTNIKPKLAEGTSPVIVGDRLVQSSVKPVRVTLERMNSGAIGYTIADIRKIAKLKNSPARVDALKDEEIEAILDEMAKNPNMGIWHENDFILKTRGPDAAKDNEKLSSLAVERKKLSEENETLKKQVADLQKQAKR